MSAFLHKTAREEYLERLEREDIARNAERVAREQTELKASVGAGELMEWRKLAGIAINTAERCGGNVDWLRMWEDELIDVRTDEQWQELEETLPF